MHQAAYRAWGEDWRYQLLPVPPHLLAETAAALPAAGFDGVNVTIPHKETALALADEATQAALQIGAANTLSFRDGRIEAANTDASGLLAALPGPVSGARAVVLGAGGSARAAVWALLSAGAGEVTVWNRTPERARRLCAQLGGRAAERIEGVADLLVNCTAVGLGAADDPWRELPLAADGMGGYGCVVDLVYGDADTELIAVARRAGAHTVDGLEVLVHQGAGSLELWAGRSAPLPQMRAAVRAAA
jgi:shikimate dehydrogenase